MLRARPSARLTRRVHITATGPVELTRSTRFTRSFRCPTKVPSAPVPTSCINRLALGELHLNITPRRHAPAALVPVIVVVAVVIVVVVFFHVLGQDLAG